LFSDRVARWSDPRPHAFAAQQLGRLAAETRTYQILNLIGGFFLCIAAIVARQYGFILLEGTSTIASGMWRVMR
jgi:hypothetical protein